MTIDLFPQAEKVETPRPPCFLTLAARRKLARGEDWHWCNFERVGADALLEGGVPSVYVRGKRAGLNKWEGVKLERVVVTRAELDSEMCEYESITGRCRSCAGSGLERGGWSAETGDRFRTCKRCGGSGKPQEVSL